ncbi:Endo-chitosanase [Trichoderma lentiforme]|uniref:Endo-chitosanase n=1 Tax=Trichoderma lentiforme TaxID=1567552 RepID=A0A9P4XEY8_9HYPO|nr:Endo-chitosanase [Trichoderma lentiforme]
MASFKTAVLASLAGAAAARSVPANVQSLYNSIVAQGSCRSPLATGFYSSDGDGGTTSYCGDHLADYGIVYLQGTNGRLANMDIDCDGIQGGPADDGRCGDSGDTQDVTAFSDTVRGYGTGQRDLDANAHPYVVFGNEGSGDWDTWDPQSVGVEPLSVMAVVCNNQLIYGVWGDTNGDDGDFPVVGEASISLATACFGESINGNNGHDQTDVLYIAFTGSSAVPGARGASWNAQDYNDFENSISALGDSLVARIGTTSGGDPGNGGGGDPGNGGSGGDCSWEGHCAGASCGSDDDCSDDLTCSNGFCGGSPPSGGNGGGNGGGSSGDCSWEGHCAGASCGSDDDCSDDLTCSNGFCGGSSGGNSGGGGSNNCSWAGHCAGASCGSDDDCSDDLFCSNGRCTN